MDSTAARSNRKAKKLTPVSQQPQPAGSAGLLAFSLLAFTEQQLICLIYVYMYRYIYRTTVIGLLAVMCSKCSHCGCSVALKH